MRKQRGFFGITGVAIYVIIGLSIALALSWAGSGLAIWYLDGKAEKAQEKATAAESARAKEEQSRKGFEAAAGACTASVTALQKRAADAEAAYAKGQGVSQGLSAAVQGHINAMLNRPRPAGLDECGAMKYELAAEIDHRAARKR